MSPPSDISPPADHALAGIGYKILSTFFFAIMVAIVKYASDTVPTGEIMFSRSFFALIPLVVMGVMGGNLRDCLVTTYPWRHVVRCMVGIAGMFTWFVVLAILPLPEATAISFAAPLLVVILAAVFLKEKVRFYRWTAVFIGLIGVLIILWPRLISPDNGVAGFGVMLAIFSTGLIALASILIRRLTATEKNASIIFYFTVSGTLLSLISLYWGWVMPSWEICGLLVLLGLFGGMAQIAMTKAFSCSEASLLAPFDYFNMIWALLFGIYVFGEYPSPAVMVGGGVVVCAGLFIIYRENQLGLSKAKHRSVVIR